MTADEKLDAILTKLQAIQALLGSNSVSATSSGLPHSFTPIPYSLAEMRYYHECPKCSAGYGSQYNTECCVCPDCRAASP